MVISCQEMIAVLDFRQYKMDVALNYNLGSQVNGTCDREARPKFWYALKVRSCCERKVEKKLNTLSIDTYVPLRQETRQWSDRTKKISIILIPMVVLIKIEPERIPEVKKLSFVFDIFKFPGQKVPAKIPPEQIESLKFLVDSSNGQIDFKPTDFKLGDNVTIWRGDLKGLSGIIKENSNGKAKIGVIIDLLGCATAEISISDLKKRNQ